MAEVGKNYRKLMSSFLLVLSIFGCQQKTQNNKQINNLESIDKNEKKVDDFQPEISINKLLYLRDDTSIGKFYKDSKDLINIDSVRETPVMMFSNKTSDEYLMAYQYEGDTQNEFSCFEIGYYDGKTKSYVQTDYKKFATESGLRLGLNLEEVERIKGKDYVKQDNKIVYQISDTNSAFLRNYNMPEYFLECDLQQNKIVKIKFGFVYP
ncbi:MAG: hypothetical protein E2604_10475 [Flavobacterium sp.]|nr:hypothetical protein [Flavobacterium sp.]